MVVAGGTKFEGGLYRILAGLTMSIHSLKLKRTKLVYSVTIGKLLIQSLGLTRGILMVVEWSIDKIAISSSQGCQQIAIDGAISYPVMVVV